MLFPAYAGVIPLLRDMRTLCEGFSPHTRG